MHIYPWISTRTHYLKKELSISIIYNAKHMVYYLLKGVGSKLWKLIVKYQDIDKVESFAKSNHCENELYSLLAELKEKEIISLSEIYKKVDYNHLSKPICFVNPDYMFFYFNWSNVVFKLGYINSLYIELSYKCNLKCKHCYNHKNMNEYVISFKQAKKAIDEAYDLGISTVTLTGGEPTINEDFLKIAKYIRSRYLELHINTNGQVLYDDEKLFKELVDIYPSCIKLSLYSMDSNVHDYITGVEGSWKKTINVIEKLNKCGIFTTIATPVLSYNKNCYKEVKEYADKNGIWSGGNCVFINNPENNNLSAKLDYKDLEQFYIDKLENPKNITKKNFEKNDIAICEAGYERVCVNPKFEVTPCVAVDYVLGNLNLTTLNEIKETTLIDFRKKFVRKNLKECFKEEYCKYCFYCSDTASFNNSFMKKQPILCENAKAYYNAVLFNKKRGIKYEETSKI